MYIRDDTGDFTGAGVGAVQCDGDGEFLPAQRVRVEIGGGPV